MQKWPQLGSSCISIGFGWTFHLSNWSFCCHAEMSVEKMMCVACWLSCCVLFFIPSISFMPEGNGVFGISQVERHCSMTSPGKFQPKPHHLMLSLSAMFFFNQVIPSFSPLNIECCPVFCLHIALGGWQRVSTLAHPCLRKKTSKLVSREQWVLPGGTV